MALRVPRMSPDVDVLLERARAWVAEDPDARTRAELEQLLVGSPPVDAGGDPPTSPTGSTAPSSSAPPGCAARSAPGPTG